MLGRCLFLLMMTSACGPMERAPLQRIEGWLQEQVNQQDRAQVPMGVCGQLVLRGVAQNCRDAAGVKVPLGAIGRATFDLVSRPDRTGQVVSGVTAAGFAVLTKAAEAAPQKAVSQKALVLVQVNKDATDTDMEVIQKTVASLPAAPSDVTPALTAREACKLLLFGMTLNARCMPAERKGISSWANDRADIRLVNNVMLGQVLTFDDDASFQKTIEQASSMAMFLGPHRYSSKSHRFFVLLDDAAPKEVGDKVRQALDRL